SRCPSDSPETYASHRPSGENRGSHSILEVLANGLAAPAFHPDASRWNGRIMTSSLVPGFISSNARNSPLGCHDPGCCAFALVVRRSASPVPSARAQYKFLGPSTDALFEANVMRTPSGVHTGLMSCAGLVATRVIASLAGS